MHIKQRISVIFLLLCVLVIFYGCGGGGSSDGGTGTGTVIYPTSTPTVSIPGNVTSLSFSGDTATSQLTSGNILALYNKNTSTVSYTINNAASSSVSNVEETYYRGGKEAEDFYNALREKEKFLYNTYGDSAKYDNSNISSSAATSPQTFWVQDDNSNDVQVTATLRATGTYCYVFVDNNSNMTNVQAQQVANEWDGHIYNDVVKYFGSPTNVDNDIHIYILLSPVLNGGADTSIISGLYGYFYSRDQYPTSVSPYSNYKDIIYLNSAFLVAGNSYDILEFFSTLAHEFQHMVNYNYKRGNEDTSFNEGCSMLAEMLTGYGLPGGSGYAYQAVKSFEINPGNYSVTSWSAGKSYGLSFLFMCYIYDRFGADTIKSLVSGSSNGGTENIENVTGVSFESLYRDWVIANIQDGVSQDGRYTYKSFRMAGTFGGKYYQGQSLPGIQCTTIGSGSLKPWGVVYMQSQSSSVCTVTGSNLGGLIFSN